MNLFLRIVSSIVLLPIVLGALFFSATTTLLLVLLAFFLAFSEYQRLVAPSSLGFPLISTLAFALLALGGNASFISVVSGGVLGVLLWHTFSSQTNKDSLFKSMALVGGTLYVGLPLLALYFLRLMSLPTAPQWGLSLILLALVVTFGNDTFAYFSGRLLGCHPLFKTVSAKKTWEGFFGGAIATLALPFILKASLAHFQVEVFTELSTADLLWVSLPALFLAPLGDLCESKLKRLFDAKDSGHLLPGHGGLLDRIDALLMVVFWTFTYASLIQPLC